MAAPKAEAPAKGAAPEAAPSAAPAKKGGIGAWIPVIVALVLAPVATWGTVEFVLLPRLQKKIAAAGPASAGPAVAVVRPFRRSRGGARA